MARIRFEGAVREQGVIRFEMPEDALPAEHPARVLWHLLGRLDLTSFTKDAKAVDGHAGRPVLCTRMLLTLWLYAISVGVGSAREIARRVRIDRVFEWITGGKSVSHQRLSEFRVGHGEALDKRMTDVLATLMQQGLLSLERVAQDGTRIRASASAPSFRRMPALEQCREQAALHLKAVLAAADDPEITVREQAAREAGARDFQRRVEAAIATAAALADEGKPESRASTTDAEARVMKMADGGFRPAYNVQLAVAGSNIGGPRTIVAVNVTNIGSDMRSVEPMLDQLQRRLGELPKQLLADANHADHDSIRAAHARGVEAIIAIPKRTRDAGPAGDHDEPIAAWRARMKTDQAKLAYRSRASLCELANASAKSRFGLTAVLVRGLAKVTQVGLLMAISANLLAHASALVA